MSTRREVHAQTPDGNDYTLCGFAYEGSCLDGDEEAPSIANSGDMVTCEKCRSLIAYRKTFKRNRHP